MNKNYNSKYLKYKMKYLHEKENLIGGVRGKRIILFAISANPPTISHINIVKQLASQYYRVVVWTSTNPLKENPNHNDYDPHYLPADKRIEMFKQCVEALCLENVIFDQEYADLYSGVSICKYIERNLILAAVPEDRINDVPFKQFSVKDATADSGLSKERYELWICFGKDVVADTPNWSYNNLFLTLATGIVMIEREDTADYSIPRYSTFTKSNIDRNIKVVEGIKYFTMPCIKKKEKKVKVKVEEREIEVTQPFEKEDILANINKECYNKNIETLKQYIVPDVDGPLCIVEKKSLEHLGDTSSSRVRNYMMLWHLTEKSEDKEKIVKKLLQMVPEQVLDEMKRKILYTIPESSSKNQEELNKRRKILEKLGAPTNQQIIARIVDKEIFG